MVSPISGSTPAQVIVPPVPPPPGVHVPPPGSVTVKPWGTSTVTEISLVVPPPHVLSPAKSTLRE